MKKIYFLLASIFILSFGLKAQQSFQFIYDGNIIGDTLKIQVTENGTEQMFADFIHFKNITSSPIEVKVALQIIEINPTAAISMCFNGSCLLDTISPSSITLNPNVEYTEFDLMYTTTSQATSLIRLHLINPTTNESLQSIIVHYKNHNISLAKPIVSNPISLEAYPNPAVQSATIKYSLPSNQGRLSLVVRNILGKEVKTIELGSSLSGKQIINTSDLPNGVYFYSIIDEGRTISTKKLIVKH